MSTDGGEGRSWRRVLRRMLLVAAVVLVALQAVPYGWGRSNPPVRADAPWPSARAEELARRACYSCHSNETDWPAYAYVAPMSWLVRWDVDRGRDELNFSRWDDDADEADDAVETIVEGSMPPARYTVLHPEAGLDRGERQELIDALAQMRRSGRDDDPDDD